MIVHSETRDDARAVHVPFGTAYTVGAVLEVMYAGAAPLNSRIEYDGARLAGGLFHHPKSCLTGGVNSADIAWPGRQSSSGIPANSRSYAAIIFTKIFSGGEQRAHFDPGRKITIQRNVV